MPRLSCRSPRTRNSAATEVAPICERLEEAGYLHRTGENWHWTQQAYPADTVSLRAVTSDNFVIVDTTGAPEVIGEVDFPSALTTVHPKAIYLHQGQQYQVDRLDFDERRAYVRRVNLEYYTDAIRYTQVRVLEVAETARAVPRWLGQSMPRRRRKTHGDVMVRSQVVGFKKIKFFTNENLGSGNLELPENEMHTTAFWLTLERPSSSPCRSRCASGKTACTACCMRLNPWPRCLLMCDRRDLGSGHRRTASFPGLGIEWEERPDEERELFEPNLYLYDAYPGGIGFSEPLYCAADLLLSAHPRINFFVPLRTGLPVMRRPVRRRRRTCQGSSYGNSGTVCNG